MSNPQQPPREVPQCITDGVSKLKEDSRCVVKVVGHIENGKLVLDHESLAQLNKDHPDAYISFVALNAPFMARGELVR
jgi:hypothetical protein